MNKYITTIILFTLPLLTWSQGVTKAFVSMPDEIFPYLNKENRELLIHEHFEATDKAKIEVANTFGSKSELLQLIDKSVEFSDSTINSSDGFIHIKLSENSEMQLFQEFPDTCFYMIFTYFSPESESIIHKYDSKWRKIGSYNPDYNIDSFISDTTSVALREKIKTYCEWSMYQMRYDYDEKCLIISLNLPNLTKDEYDDIKPCLTSRKVKIGNIFTKES